MQYDYCATVSTALPTLSAVSLSRLVTWSQARATARLARRKIRNPLASFTTVKETLTVGSRIEEPIISRFILAGKLSDPPDGIGSFPNPTIPKLQSPQKSPLPAEMFYSSQIERPRAGNPAPIRQPLSSGERKLRPEPFA
jgi:hypothetical protein